MMESVTWRNVVTMVIAYLVSEAFPITQLHGSV